MKNQIAPGTAIAIVVLIVAVIAGIGWWMAQSHQPAASTSAPPVSGPHDVSKD